jgi:hypothetical protein
MRKFEMKEQRAAIQYAADGNQALHLHTFTQNGHPLFKRYKVIAHLFDQDVERLISTVKRFGVRNIKVEYRGLPPQHIDLCGLPFERACTAAAQDEFLGVP